MSLRIGDHPYLNHGGRKASREIRKWEGSGSGQEGEEAGSLNLMPQLRRSPQLRKLTGLALVCANVPMCRCADVRTVTASNSLEARFLGQCYIGPSRVIACLKQ